MKHTQVHLLWRDRTVCRDFRTGVSLHSHTMHSRESLSSIPVYASYVPLLARELERLARGYQAKHGRPVDYSRAHWTPPLPEREAHELEKRSIEDHLDLAALVSLSDHDSIEAGCGLRQLAETSAAPISVEWTVPLAGTYFHLGVHNLPPQQARSIMVEMAAYTHQPSEARRQEILAVVNRHEDTLVVLNHPLWAQSGCGTEHHRAALGELLIASGNLIHAIELNGLRPWEENRAVMDWAPGSDYPLISGGDRHACEPNSVVNLTNAASFPEFVGEVRAGHSVVAFHDRYKEPRGFRIIKALSDIMGEYPDIPSRARWSDRVFCKRYCGAITPISELWDGEVPRVVRLFDLTVRLARSQKMRSVLGFCFGGGTEIELETSPAPEQ